MLCELIAISYVLRKWNEYPLATKRQIGVWSHWKDDSPQNDRPLLDAEVCKMKSYLMKYAPSDYRSIFGSKFDEE